jgi:predicted RNA-binding protein YlxR (DUF448 family)
MSWPSRYLHEGRDGRGVYLTPKALCLLEARPKAVSKAELHK